MRSKFRFLKNTIALLCIGGIGFFVFKQCSGEDKKMDPLALDETPLHIESVRKIAELATLSFKDEVVADTVEYYKSNADLMSGNLRKLIDPNQVKYIVQNSGMKRRLTLIVKGEARIGFNLTINNYNVVANQDSVWIHFPKAKILDLTINPSQTEIFQENGTWNDYARKQLLRKARTEMERNVERNKLTVKAEIAMRKLIHRILQEKRTILIYFE